jgi:hypothetical protein
MDENDGGVRGETYLTVLYYTENSYGLYMEKKIYMSPYILCRGRKVSF